MKNFKFQSICGRKQTLFLFKKQNSTIKYMYLPDPSSVGVTSLIFYKYATNKALRLKQLKWLLFIAKVILILVSSLSNLYFYMTLQKGS